MKNHRLLILLSIFLVNYSNAQTPYWLHIASGGEHNVALKSDSTLWAWGRNAEGQLGNGSTVNGYCPVQVGNQNSWIKVACHGNYTLAIKSNGTLWAWGDNRFGQLGMGTSDNNPHPIPVQIGIDTNWTTITGGGVFVLALKSNGKLWGWGRHSDGEFGDGNAGVGPFDYSPPVQLGNDNDWTSISCDNVNALALKSNGTLWGWGWNGYGQLGNGTTATAYTKIQIGTANDWSKVTCGAYCTFALKQNGTLWAWGYNNHGQLGDGTIIEKHLPLLIGNNNNWAEIKNAEYHTIAIRNDGTLWGWGWNFAGQLGFVTTNNDFEPSPVLVSSPSNVIIIAAGFYHSAIIKNDRNHVCLSGYNGNNALGNGNTTYQYSFGCFVPAIPTVFYQDADGDGYGNLNNSIQTCIAPSGYVSNNTDCNDSNGNVHPNASENCNTGIDDNCNGQVNEGCPPVVLTLRIFIEGFYLAQKKQTSVLVNSGISSDTTLCDVIMVKLHSSLNPSNIVATATVPIKTDGFTSITFSSFINTGTYYISVSHRNSIQTWSKLPVTFSTQTSFDFTTN